MRTINDIQKEILDQKNQTASLNALEVLTNDENTLLSTTSTSKVALWRLWVYLVAVAIYVHEQLWEVFKKEIEDIIATSRVHNLKWYREKALAYLHGYDLNESDVYDTSNLTAGQIAAAKIIANAAPTKQIISGYGALRMKVVKKSGHDLAPLTATELAGFTAYMNLVSDAGTSVIPTSGVADDLKLELDVYYNPLILDATGARLDGTATTPVKDAINTYLKSLEFNGQLILTKLVDYLQKESGVFLPVIKNAYSKYGGYGYLVTNINNAGKINEIRIADAGYMVLDDANTTINYIAYYGDIDN